jgi:hypothetical protein
MEVGIQKSILFASNEDLVKKEQEEAKKEAQRVQSEPLMTSLAGHVRKAWEAAKDEKTDIEASLLRSKRQREGVYDPHKLAKIRAQGQSEIFIKLTDIKCRAVEAWLKSVYRDSGRPYRITPTPIPDLPQSTEEAVAQSVHREAIMAYSESGQPIPPEEEEKVFEKIREETLKEIKELAQLYAEQLEVEIDDDMIEGAWYDALNDVIYDIVTYKTGFIEGPIFRNKQVLEWAEDENGNRHAVVTTKVLAEYERLSPYDVYPAPGAKSLQEGDLCVKYRYTRSQLYELIGVDGYNEDAIRLALDEYDAGSMLYEGRVESERAYLEDRNRDEITRSNYIEAIKFIGNIKGQLLIDWGLEVEDPLRDYSGIVVLAGTNVISARLNPDPLGRKNVYGASFIKSNDSPWGTSVPEAMADIQELCNGCMRAIATNMSLASGPQVWMDSSKLKPGQKVTSLHAWKIWQYELDETPGAARAPMEFFQPNPIVDQLLKLYDYIFNQASEVTGIPTYIYGSADTSGAAETASGLSMLMNAASKVLQAVALNIDNGIIKPSVEAHWLHIMLNEPEKAGGDINIVPRASGYLIQAESLNVRRQEFLDRTMNDVDMGIIGVPGRAEVLREQVKNLKMNTNIVPPREELLMQQENQMMGAQVEEIITNISEQLGIPPEELMAIAQGMQPTGAMGTPQEAVTPSGAPMGGTNLMQLNGPK